VEASNVTENPADARRSTAIVFAHQDDDLLWMLPFWASACLAVLAATPATPTLRSIVDRHDPRYRSIWRPVWGEVSDEEYVDVWANADARRGIVTAAAIRDKLYALLCAPHVDTIVTHNPWGEYGHIQHRLVSDAACALAVELGKSVYCLDVVADIRGGRYADPGDFGLPTVSKHFDHEEFSRHRDLYLSTSFSVPIARFPNAWTWHTGAREYPTDARRFLMLVREGVDLTKDNTALAQLRQEVPVFDGSLRRAAT
jgi:hypothetical protein